MAVNEGQKLAIHRRKRITRTGESTSFAPFGRLGTGGHGIILSALAFCTAWVRRETSSLP